MLLCFVCLKQFCSSDSLTAHVQLYHSEYVRSNNLRCGQPSCSRSFDRLYCYSRHIKSHSVNVKSLEQSTSIGAEHCDAVNYVQVEENSNSIHQNNVTCEDAARCNIPDDSNVQCEPLVFEQSISNAAFGFLGKLYNIESLPRSYVQTIMECVLDIVNGPHVKSLESKCLSAIQKSDNKEAANEIKQMFSSFCNMFSGLETEFKRIKAFTDTGAYIKPEAFVIGNAVDERNSQGSVVREPIEIHGQFISMLKTLEGFLELPGVLKSIVNYMETLENENSSVIKNFVQGSLWKDIIKPKFGEKLTLPLCLYFDEYEPGDSSGHHSGVHKLGGVYFNIPCIPPEFRSSTDNIMLAMIFYASDKDFGYEDVFRRVINEIHLLENNGITVSTDEGNVQVYFALSLFLGDNAGVHAVLGFSEGFRANFFCRRCKVHRTVTESQTNVDLGLLRDLDNYNADVQIKNLTLTGIKSHCIFNQFQAYHCITNLCFDIMHDLEEGAWDYDMCLIILHLLKKKCFTLDGLNNRVQGFDYGPTEFSNKPGLITQDHLDKLKLKMTAAETLCFVRYFGLMVGDVVMPDIEQLWQFYNVVHELTMLLTKPVISIEEIDLIACLVTEHHSLYLQLFPCHTLKPKHHMMLHYSECIKKVGPLINVSCWRFEAKHKIFQKIAKSGSNYKNLPLTLSIKHQLKFCQRLLCQRGFEKKLLTSNTRIIPSHHLECYDDINDLLPPKFQKVVNTVKWADVHGTTYKVGMVLVTGLGDEYPVFSKVKVIIYDDDSQIISFVVAVFHTVCYSTKYCAHEVVETSEMFIVEHGSLINFCPTIDRTGPDGHMYVAYRFKL